MFKNVPALAAHVGLLVAGGVVLRFGTLLRLLLHAFLEQTRFLWSKGRLRVLGRRTVCSWLHLGLGLLLYERADLRFDAFGLRLVLTEVILVHCGEQLVSLLQYL